MVGTVGQRLTPDSSYRGKKPMERVTLRIPRQQVEQVEELVETGEYPNRSEAIRSAVRTMVDDDEQRSRPDRDVAQV